MLQDTEADGVEDKPVLPMCGKYGHYWIQGTIEWYVYNNKLSYRWQKGVRIIVKELSLYFGEFKIKNLNITC